MKLNTKTPYPKDSYYKVNYSSNYADEFDVNGFQVFSGKEVNDLVLGIKKIFKQGQFTHNIGTNECIEYSTMKELVATLSVKKITETQYKVLEDLNLLGSGMFPDIDDFSYEDEDSDQEDNDARDTLVLIKRRIECSSKLSIDVPYDPTSCFTLHYFDSKPEHCIYYKGFKSFTGYELNSYIASIKERFTKGPYEYDIFVYDSLEQFIDKFNIIEIARSEYDILNTSGMLHTGVFPADQ